MEEENKVEEQAKEMSFDDFLKEGTNQSEFDRRVSKAISTAIANERSKWETLQSEQATEAEKMAKMNKDEQAEYLIHKREKELSDREAELNRRELKAEAKNTLAEKNLPLDLAELLVYTNADTCHSSIEALEKAFSAAVEKAAEERLKGGEPLKKAKEQKPDLSAEVRNAISHGDTVRRL